MVHIFTISRWEFRRTGLSFNRKTLIFSLILIILIGIISFFVSQHGIHINDNIYKVVVTDPKIGRVLLTDDKFEVYTASEGEAKYLFEHGGFDIMILGNKVNYHISERSISSIDALDKAIIRYEENQLIKYNDLNNTFPVWITVRNIEREQVFEPLSLQKLPEFENTPEKETPSVTATEKVRRKTENAPSIEKLTDMENALLKEQELATPTHFNPPIPFKSVVTSFLYIFPIYFIAQLFSSSIMGERTKRKGELLLVSPARPFEIVIGKLLPYLLITLVLMAGITIYIGGTVWLLFILFPVSLMFLSTAFMAAIIARSFKELTFVLIFLSISLSGYIFFPAMFVNIHAISTISPMTLVVQVLEGGTISIGDYLFSTVPFYLVSILIFMFGIFIYHEEDLFTQRSIKKKILDSFSTFMGHVPMPLFFLSIALLPIVFSVQLMLIVLMFNFSIKFGVIIFIFSAALIEEIVKSAGIYTVFSRKLTSVTTWNAFKAGIFSGFGFFVGEKMLLLIVISSIAGSVFGSVMGIGLLIFPLLLHITSTTISSLGMRYLGTGNYIFSVILATVVHSGYNLYLVRGVLFG